MSYSKERLAAIFRRTDGRCHLCHGVLALKNYGVTGARGAWQVEHSRPRAHGGTDHGHNLYAAHVRCNARKGTRSSRSARADHGKTRAPYSPKKKEAVRTENTAVGLIGGALIGVALAGPPGALVGAVFGGVFGSDREVI